MFGHRVFDFGDHIYGFIFFFELLFPPKVLGYRVCASEISGPGLRP